MAASITPSFVQLPTDSTGKKVAASTYTENSNTVYDQKVIPGEVYLPVYTVVTTTTTGEAANSHLIELMAGSTLNVRVRRIMLCQHTDALGVNVYPIQIWRTTTAGSGGTAITPNPLQTTDVAAGATAQMLPSSKGTEGVQLWQETIWNGTTAIPVATNNMRINQLDFSKPIVIPAGATNGIAIKNTAHTSSQYTFDITIEFTETSF